MTLQELEQLALQNNPATTAAAAAVDAARAQTAQAGAWPNPMIGYTGAELTGGPDVRGQHGFFVEQTIPLGGKLRLSHNAFQQAIAQVEAARDLQQLRTLGSVRQAYYGVLLVERRIEVQERMVKLAAESAGVTAQLFNVGAADRPDFLESEIASRRVQLQLAQSRNDLRAQRARLAAIAGSPEVAERPLAAAGDSPVPRARTGDGDWNARGTESRNQVRPRRARAHQSAHRPGPPCHISGSVRPWRCRLQPRARGSLRPVNWMGRHGRGGRQRAAVQPKHRRHRGRTIR